MTETTVIDSSDGLIVTLDIYDVEPFHANPRIYKNSMYDQIKQSIRERGVLQNLIAIILDGEKQQTAVLLLLCTNVYWIRLAPGNCEAAAGCDK